MGIADGLSLKYQAVVGTFRKIFVNRYNVGRALQPKTLPRESQGLELILTSLKRDSNQLIEIEELRRALGAADSSNSVQPKHAR